MSKSSFTYNHVRVGTTIAVRGLENVTGNKIPNFEVAKVQPTDLCLYLAGLVDSNRFSLAPDGCLSFYPQISGDIKTFNYDHAGCYR